MTAFHGGSGFKRRRQAAEASSSFVTWQLVVTVASMALLNLEQALSLLRMFIHRRDLLEKFEENFDFEDGQHFFTPKGLDWRLPVEEQEVSAAIEQFRFLSATGMVVTWVSYFIGLLLFIDRARAGYFAIADWVVLALVPIAGPVVHFFAFTAPTKAMFNRLRKLLEQGDPNAIALIAKDAGHGSGSILSHTGSVGQRDYTREAEALFARFAERHGLAYRVETGVPMEVCCTLPEQERLFLPITLGLSNGDELSFGVSDFWSYFFPFERAAEKFESILDAWVVGDARVAITGRRCRLLQVREGEEWVSVYSANGCLFPFRRRPLGFVYNRRSG